MKINLLYINAMTPAVAREAFFACCGSKTWVDGLAKYFPFSDESGLQAAVDAAFAAMSRSDWLEAFTHHPMIGDVKSIREKFATTAHLAASEQSGVAAATDQVFSELAAYNQKYFQKFGFIFIICASGKSAEFMLDALKKRYNNGSDTEVENAAAEQKKITWLRLEKIGKS